MKKLVIICLILVVFSVACRTVPQTVIYDIENGIVVVKEDSNVTIVHMKEGTTLEIKNGKLIQGIE